jgi:DNA-binding NtrC family response regulator
MNQQNIDILIVSHSITLQRGLGALLESLPGIASVKAIRDLGSAYAWIEAHQPGIVLLDAILLRNRAEAALEKIRSLSPRTQRVLLVDDMHQVDFVPRYSEAILIKGISPSALTVIMTNLLSEKGEDHEHNDSH